MLTLWPLPSKVKLDESTQWYQYRSTSVLPTHVGMIRKHTHRRKRRDDVLPAHPGMTLASSAGPVVATYARGWVQQL
ncbi:hypothetical protein Atai01_79730 [Amycolatopsis taiwanensis]|uniref:Uncharacterized protein n=1 Tax=Amycolatopsis taiwanensis TaxID=342230 RepID=A0A9W6R971_9PSEU|nr:hypothetical protein Atai01_79730 [Amycolatopsis taiwanensis]